MITKSAKIIKQKTKRKQSNFWLRAFGTNATYLLNNKEIVIGNDPKSDIHIDDPYVSKEHCVLLRDGDQFRIIDQNSRNGTWVNHLRVQSCVLTSQDRIDIGKTRMQLQCDDEFSGDGFEGIIGQHELMKEVFRLINRYSTGEFSVLIHGETGTGKELVARALHDISPQAHGPFEAINCAAIPRELAESELFGHVRGAFTGASRESEGAFQRANGGTLFLDEIGEMPLELQAKLLRVLEEKKVRPLGSDRTRSVSFRLIAATHRDLEYDACHDLFRLDLFYRIAVGKITLPPLRYRTSDIPLLANYFLSQEASRGASSSLKKEVAEWLKDLEWPGNVRALRHAIQRAVVLAEGRPLEISDFSESLPHYKKMTDHLELEGKSFHELKLNILNWAYQRAGNNKSKAARLLGMAKSTYVDQLKKLTVALQGVERA